MNSKMLPKDFEERTLALVTTLFEDHTDKAGEPYLFHLMRVRDSFQEPYLRCLALLHDVLEDTSWTVRELTEFGCSDTMLATLQLLTKDPFVSYDEYISHIIESHDNSALKVKLADMMDNMKEERLCLLEEDVRLRLRGKYQKQYDRLKKAEKERNLC